jgi:hypothetical protein
MATFGVFHDLIGLPLMIGFIIWWIMKSRGVPPWITVTVYVTTIVGWFMALSSSLANLIGMGLGVIVASAILPLLLGFGLSIAFEGVLARGLIKRDNLWAAVFRANALSYILLAVIISVHAVNDPSLMTGGRASFPSRAKGTLHAIGSTQLAYQGENKARVYGSFQAMKDTLYIAEGYTLGSMIENYSMSWQVNNISTVSTEKFPSGIISTFTVIAWPSDRRRGFLSTFGVTDDQIVRVYTPQNGNRLEDVKTWDPIL